MRLTVGFTFEIPVNEQLVEDRDCFGNGSRTKKNERPKDGCEDVYFSPDDGWLVRLFEDDDRALRRSLCVFLESVFFF